MTAEELPVSREQLDAAEWDALVRDSDGNLPLRISDETLLREFRDAKRRAANRWHVCKIVITLMLAAVVIVFFGFHALPAQAQAPCGPRVATLAHLKEKYHEEIVATATTENGGLLEFTASLSGSWTLLATTADYGMTCLLTSGTEWNAKSWPGSDT